MVATLIATATPTAVSLFAPSLPSPFAAEPSATAEASMLFSALSANCPPAVMCTAPMFAVASLEATLSASAAATPTEPESSPLLSVFAFWPEVFVEPDFDCARAVVLLCWSSELLLPLPSSCALSVPAALAIACALEDPSALAVKLTAPPAVMSLAVLALALSSTNESAMAAPIAVPPAPLPSALVSLAPWCFALTSTLPLTFNASPVLIDASVALSATVIAIAPPTPVPPFERPPATTVVFTTCEPSASSLRSEPPVSLPCTSARVSFSTAMLRPTDTPTPVLPASAEAFASTIDSVVFCALSVTAPVPAFSVAPLASDACVSASVTMFSAKEPATPVSPPLPPEVAFAANSCFCAPPFISASMLAPSLVTVAPLATSAWFSMSATLIATATPTAVSLFAPSLPSPLAALPSAIADASIWFSAFSANLPPALIVTTPTLASASLDATFSASAAATPTEPESLPSLSVLALPLSPEDFDLPDLAFARSVVDFCWSSALFLPLPSVPSSWALSVPAAPAIACALEAPSALAVKLTAPPAVMFFAVVASAPSSTNESAIAAPTAVPPALFASALVSLAPWCFALTSTLPLTFSALAFGPIAALVVFSATVMAMAPPIPVPPLDRPPAVTVVLTAWLPSAAIVTSAPPVSVPSISAVLL